MLLPEGADPVAQLRGALEFEVGRGLVHALRQDVNRFLAERGTEKAPLGDLNNDGRRDYRDDYIMVGNYLLASFPATAKDKVKAGAKDAAATPAEQKPAAVPAKNAKDAKPEPGQP